MRDLRIHLINKVEARNGIDGGRLRRVDDLVSHHFSSSEFPARPEMIELFKKLIRGGPLPQH
jgi:hypothetical protein